MSPDGSQGSLAKLLVSSGIPWPVHGWDWQMLRMSEGVMSQVNL